MDHKQEVFKADISKMIGRDSERQSQVSNEKIMGQVVSWTPEPGNYAEVLDKAKQALDCFVIGLGQIKDIPLDLTQYESDFQQTELEQSLDLDGLYLLVEGTIRRMKANRKVKSNWSCEDVLILIWIVEKYLAFTRKSIQNLEDSDWCSVGSMVPGKNDRQCMFRWLSLKSNRSMDRRVWQQWEDLYLRQSVIQNDERQWLKISQELFLQKENTQRVYRTAKQCRQRWACYVNPTVKKGNWSRNEDYLLISKYLQLGKKWSIIAKSLQGRTENAVKNRWKLIINRFKIHSKKSDLTLEQHLHNYLNNLKISEQSTDDAVGIYGRQDLPQFQSEDRLEFILPWQLNRRQQVHRYFEADTDMQLLVVQNQKDRALLSTDNIDSIIGEYINNSGVVRSFETQQASNFL